MTQNEERPAETATGQPDEEQADTPASIPPTMTDEEGADDTGIVTAVPPEE